jgi:WD40 repeat protein
MRGSDVVLPRLLPMMVAAAAVCLPALDLACAQDVARTKVRTPAVIDDNYRPAGILGGHSGTVYCVAFTANGARVLTAGVNGSGFIWNVATGAKIAELKPENEDAVVSKEETDRLQDLERRLTEAYASADALQRTPTEEDEDKKADLKEIEDEIAEIRARMDAAEGLTINDCTVSRDGSKFVTASDDGTLRVWDSRSGRSLTELKGHKGNVWRVIALADGRQIASASEDGTARIWRLDTDQAVHELSGHESPVYNLAAFADGRRLATASADGTARIWDVTSGAQLLVLKPPAGDSQGSPSIYGIGVTPDGSRVVTGDDSGTAVVWDASTGQPLHTLKGHSREIYRLAVSPGGERVVTGSYDNTARIWDISTGSLLHTLAGHEKRVRNVAFTANGGRAVTASYDGTLRVWDASTGALKATLTGHEGSIFSITTYADGAMIASASRDGTARLWRNGQRADR